MYLVYYEDYSDYQSWIINLFVTDSLDYAEKYIKKFNRILEKAEKQYEELYEKDEGKWFDRDRLVKETSTAKYQEIEFSQ